MFCMCVCIYVCIVSGFIETKENIKKKKRKNKKKETDATTETATTTEQEQHSHSRHVSFDLTVKIPNGKPIQRVPTPADTEMVYGCKFILCLLYIYTNVYIHTCGCCVSMYQCVVSPTM